MRMDGHADIGGQRAHFDGQHAFGDQFAGSRPHNADAEHALSFRIDQPVSLNLPAGPA